MGNKKNIFKCLSLSKYFQDFLLIKIKRYIIKQSFMAMVDLTYFPSQFNFKLVYIHLLSIEKI